MSKSLFTNIHPALEQVRHLPEFQLPAPTWWDALKKHPVFQHFSRQIDHVLQQLIEALARLLSKMALPGVAAKVPAHIHDVFNVILSFLALIILGYLFYLILGTILQGRNSLLHWKQRPEHTANSLAISSKAHWLQAQQAAQTGNYAEGIRQLYLAALFRLDETDCLPFEESRSNREYQAALSAFPNATRDPSPATLFARLSSIFEQVHYGYKKPLFAGFENCKAIYQQLQGLLH